MRVILTKNLVGEELTVGKGAEYLLVEGEMSNFWASGGELHPIPLVETTWGWGEAPHQLKICSLPPPGKIPPPLPSSLPPPKVNNFQVITQSKHFQLQSLLLYHFCFNFVLFGHTGHANFDFNVQYSQKAVFSFEKGSNCQNHPRLQIV